MLIRPVKFHYVLTGVLISSEVSRFKVMSASAGSRRSHLANWASMNPAATTKGGRTVPERRVQCVGQQARIPQTEIVCLHTAFKEGIKRR